jgi:hypothetical protein
VDKPAVLITGALTGIGHAGTMDHWDPLVTDGLAAPREVILINDVGISSSAGEVPTAIEGMAVDAMFGTQFRE